MLSGKYEFSKLRAIFFYSKKEGLESPKIRLTCFPTPVVPQLGGFPKLLGPITCVQNCMLTPVMVVEICLSEPFGSIVIKLVGQY